MFNGFLGFFKKEFIQIFRDKKSLLILLGIPTIQILLFGFAITNEIRDVRIAILDYSKDNTTKEIISKIVSTNYFKLYKMLRNEKDIERAFQTGEIKEAIVFSQNFGQNLEKFGKANVQFINDGTDPNTATTIIGYTNSIIGQYQNEITRTRQIPLIITPEVKMRYNPELKGVFLSVPGLISIILMLISAMMTSISITKEKESGSMEVLLVSPIKPAVVIIAKVIPYAIISVTIATIVLTLGRFVFEVPIKGNLILLFAEITVYVIMSLSLGILISTVAKTQQVALFISLIGLMMPTVLLSGFIFPIENMPIWLQPFTYLIPARWFIVIIKNIMLKGSDFSTILNETLVLFLMILVTISISIKKYKIRL